MVRRTWDDIDRRMTTHPHTSSTLEPAWHDPASDALRRWADLLRQAVELFTAYSQDVPSAGVDWQPAQLRRSCHSPELDIHSSSSIIPCSHVKGVILMMPDIYLQEYECESNTNAVRLPPPSLGTKGGLDSL